VTITRLDLSVLTPITVEGRDELVRAALAGLVQPCDAIVLSSLTNIRWLTGFTGSNAVAVVGPDETVLATDGRYTTQAGREMEDSGSPARLVVDDDPVGAAMERVAPYWTLGLEDSVTWATQARWAGHADEALVAATLLVEELRAIKTPAEVERMQAAAMIVDEVLEESSHLLVPGTSEREIALALDDGMRARGSSGPAYETIVASGPNSALPHARPTERRLAEGDLLIIDAGAVVDGYRSDMTRTFAIGDLPARSEQMVEVVTRSQAAGVAVVRPGIDAGSVDEACRDVISSEGMAELFVHGTGHGVGLDIHELPRVRKGSTAILRPGHVLTVEPGVYDPDVGGVRVEDLVVVTEEGCRSLTRYPKTPFPE
jgi:Xaa-Pro aminopeptidase